MNAEAKLCSPWCKHEPGATEWSNKDNPTFHIRAIILHSEGKRKEKGKKKEEGL